jgi:adenylate cyclase
MTTTNVAAEKLRHLNLLMALDKVHDAVEVNTDPYSMFRAFAELLRSFVKADACGIFIAGDNDDLIESIVHSGVDEAAALELCRQALALDEPGSLNSADWPHTLGMPIIEGEDRTRLGGFFLARKESPFGPEDVALLQLAESQIDSAVIQARLICKVANRSRELEAIYQIDHMGDNNPSENDLIGGFTTILTDYFKAELCMILLTHTDSGELVLRGMVDKDNLPLEALETIREMTGKLSIPQIIQTPPEIERLNLLGAPLIVSGVRLGAVVVGRKTAFNIADHRLIYAMTSQMDSAIAHSRVIAELSQRNRELEAIYRIDHIRDREHDFDAMLQQVLTELCKVVASELGYLMLYAEQEERQLELKATTVDGVLTSPIYYEAITRISREALDKGVPVYSNHIDGAVRSIVAIPLILNQKIIGVFGAINSTNPRGFGVEDERMLTAITSQVDTAVFERLERRRMRRVLSRSVDPKVLERLLQKADDHLLAGERVVISVLFADLRGSTEWTERTEPERLVSTINAFLGRMTDVIFQHGGTLDKFVGDEVIGLFGTPVDMKEHALQAVKCALAMQDVHADLQQAVEALGLELPPMGIGISTGEVIAGEFGTPIRTDFTAMGRAMNLGSRLCGAASAGKILISKPTQEMAGRSIEVRSMEPLTLKGLGLVEVYEVLSGADEIGQK